MYQIIDSSSNESLLSLLTLQTPASDVMHIQSGDTVDIWVTSSNLLGNPVFLLTDLLGSVFTLLGVQLNDPGTLRSVAHYRSENMKGGDTAFTIALGIAKASVGICVVQLRGLTAYQPFVGDSLKIVASPTTSANALESDPISAVQAPECVLGLAFDSAGANTPQVGLGGTDITSCWGFGGTNRARVTHQRCMTLADRTAVFTAGANQSHFVGCAVYRESTDVLLGAGGG